MQIDVVTDMQPLSRLRENWDSLYEADPEAHYFLSSTWLFKRLERIREPWLILAARPKAHAPYVAFFPLSLKTRMRKGGAFYNELAMAGGGAADYTGFICAPEFEDGAIRGFAQYIKTLNWADLSLVNIRASGERLRRFLTCFPQDTFRLGFAARVNTDGVDNCTCPRVKLQADWESYLDTTLSSSMRQKIKRLLKQVETSGEFRITHATAETFDNDLFALLRMWEAQWGDRKGERLGNILRSTRTMLKDCFESKSLFLPVLWKGETPVGALAILIDAKKRSLLFYIGARDESLKNPAPGLVLHAYSIRKAIAEGFTTYDFLRGNEAYKYAFGAEEHHIKCIMVRTATGRNLGGKLDPRSLPAVLGRTTALHEAGRFDEAERGYRLVLDMDPRCSSALFRFGQLMSTRRDHRAAEELFRALLAVAPASGKAWFRLGKALEAQGRISEAADAFREAIRLEPGLQAADYNLGKAQFEFS